MTRRVTVLVATAAVAAICTSCADHGVHSPAAASGTRPGGTLTVGVSPATSVDPATAADPSGVLIVRTMCDSLIEADPATGALKPAIAESWLISDGGRRFTIRLRKGVRFSNGQEVTAEDVVFSLSRVANEELASPLADLLAPIEGFEQVHGLEDVKEERLRKTLRGLRVIEKYSLEVSLSRPDADFITVFAHTLASPVPKAAAEHDVASFARRPICAGPYELAAPWAPGQPSVILRRNPHYRPVSAAYTAAGRGYADTIELRSFADKNGEADAFEAGTLDVAHLPRTMLGKPTLSADIVRAPSGSVEYLGLPVRVPPFDNPGVRIALSEALDRRSIIATALSGAAEPARGFVPPTVAGVQPQKGCLKAAPDTSDVDAARSTLARAGVDLRGTFVRLYFDDEFYLDGISTRSLAQAVRAQWETAFGLTVVMVPVQWDAYLTLGRTANGFDGPFRLTSSSPYPSADAYLAQLFSSDSIGVTNLSRYSDADFDRQLENVARKASRAEDRALDYDQLAELVCAQLPAIPLDVPTVNHLVRKALIGSARDSYTDAASGEVVLRELFRRT